MMFLTISPPSCALLVLEPLDHAHDEPGQEVGRQKRECQGDDGLRGRKDQRYGNQNGHHGEQCTTFRSDREREAQWYYNRFLVR
jgi:hypothetical protein